MNALASELSPLQNLVFAYAMTSDRLIYKALFALDNRCAAILRGTKELMLGQMRLAWWRDVIGQPAGQRPRGDAVLDALGVIEQRGVTLMQIVPLIDAWEALLLSEIWDQPVINAFAHARGATVFAALGAVTDCRHPALEAMGAAWALADIGHHVSSVEIQSDVMLLLQRYRSPVGGMRVPRRLRPLSILHRLAMADIKAGSFNAPPMRPATAARVIWHGLTGL